MKSILIALQRKLFKKICGAVSIFVNETNKESKYKHTTTYVIGNTLNNYLSKNYVNINFKKIFI